MEDQEFKLRSYGFGELAQLYLPYITPKSASNRLRTWIDSSPGLSKQLELLGYKKGQRSLTPLQVNHIVSCLGEP